MTALHRRVEPPPQTEQVNGWTRNTLGAQKINAGELTKELAAAYDTPMKQLSASTHELEVQMGTALLPVLDSVLHLRHPGTALETRAFWPGTSSAGAARPRSPPGLDAAREQRTGGRTAAAKLPVHLSARPDRANWRRRSVGMRLWTRSRTPPDRGGSVQRDQRWRCGGGLVYPLVCAADATIRRIANSVIGVGESSLYDNGGAAHRHRSAALIVRYRDQILAALTSLGGSPAHPQLSAASCTITSVRTRRAGRRAELIHVTLISVRDAPDASELRGAADHPR